MQIGVAAHSGDYPRQLELAARGFVRELPSACSSPKLILGGYWGLMKVVVDEALRAGIESVLVLPMGREDVELPRTSLITVIRSGMEYRARSVLLVRSSDALVALGGSSGTIIEVMMAYAMGKPVVVLHGYGMASDRLRDAFGPSIDSRETSKILYTSDPAEAARMACEHGRRESPLDLYG